MKFVMVSKYGEGANILARIGMEDNDISLFITEKDCRDKWEGLIPKVNKLPYDKDSIYVFDMTGNGDIADDLISTGHYVFAGSKLADKLESDRNFGSACMQKVGIPTPETIDFKSFDDARSFLQEKGDRYVFKPCGELPTKLTYVADDVDDLILYLDYVENKFSKGGIEFQLQKFIKGTDISTEGWFNGYHFVLPFNHTIENKEYANGGLGQSTGCQGNIVKICDVDRLTKQLKKIEPILQGKYIGPVDINIMMTESEEYGLEWTPRFGYDSIPVFSRLYEGDLGKLFYELAHKTFDGNLEISSDFGAAIRASVPPYPYDPIKDHDIECSDGLPIQGVVEDSIDDYYFYEIKAGKNDNLVVSSGCGLLLCTLGMASDPNDAINQCYQLLEELKVPELYYRTDLCDIMVEDYEEAMSLIKENVNHGN